MTYQEQHIQNTLVDICRSTEAIQFETNPKEVINQEWSKYMSNSKAVFNTQKLEYEINDDMIHLYIDTNSDIVIWTLPYGELELKSWFYKDEIEELEKQGAGLCDGDICEWDLPMEKANVLQFFSENIKDAKLTIE